MGLSKTQRISILLGIDLVFFFIELISGYAVHSLALVADSFHMLNDVLSLCVGLWAVRVANNKKTSAFTYGWQRAETLGALINGVFLVALCVTIFLEAVQRFFEPQEVNNPQLILIVGCLGLASNLMGLVLFHDHSHGPGGHSHGGHSHGEEGHSHDELSDAEQGHVHRHDSDETIADEAGNIADVLPQTTTGAWGSSNKHVKIQEPSNHHRRKSSARSRSRNPEQALMHPASFRQEIIQQSYAEAPESENATDNEEEVENEPAGHSHGASSGNERTPLIVKSNGHNHSHGSHSHDHSHDGYSHAGHKHNEPRKATGGGGHGHSHDDLNMRGVFLHVMGDALGNIGVIATALFIWKTDFTWRFYSDPVISLVITVIIMCSAWPLCKAASRILLQGVPAGIDVADIEDDILRIPEIDSCHHIHVWQLSDTKLIASLHVGVAFEFEGQGSQRYMKIAREIRRCLHAYGIHSSTIQPEFCVDGSHGHKMVSSREHTDDEETVGEGSSGDIGQPKTDEHGCLLDCDDECGDGGKCCDPADEVKNSKKK